MNSQEISERSSIHPNTYRLVGYGLVAAMMACAAMTMAGLVNRFIPAWQPWAMAGLCFLVALDRLYTYRRLREWLFLSREWLVSFGAQWIVILVLTKLVVGLSHGLNAFLAEVLLWQQDFIAYFFNIEFLIALVMILATWVVGGSFAILLEEIRVDETLLAEDDSFTTQQGKPLARERLLGLFFSMGIVLVLCTAFTRLDLRAIFAGRSGSFLISLPPLAGGGASTLLYFMLGLALLSQTQFIALHVRWNMQRIPVSGKLAARWALYSVLFLAFMAAVVSLLPTSYSLNPLAMLGYILNVAFLILFYIVQVSLLSLMLLLSPLFQLFGLKAPAKSTGPSAPELPAPPIDVGAAIASPLWWEFIKSLVFWSIFLGILLFSVIQYFRQHEEALQSLRKLPGWQFIEEAWGWILDLLIGVKDSASRVLEAGRKRLRSRRAATRELFENGFLSLRSLDPRQRVTFFYLALVRRGAENGLPRSQAQTPYEYAATLEEALPTAGKDIDSLTDAFIEARYTRREVKPEKAKLVKVVWERIQKALRGR